MTYCGRPSTACHTCREKRGKCDRKKPGCGQCARKRIPCPGYPDPSAVVFRDQTLATTRKVQAGKAYKETQAGKHINLPKPESNLPRDKAPYSASIALITPADKPESNKILLPMSLSVVTEDVATTFFLTSYAPASPTVYLSDLADTLRNEGLSAAAILAPALATLSRELVQPSLMALARKHYLVAIQQTNNALKSPQLAVKDATLASVLLLALFEAFAFQGRRSPTGWTMHMDGATQLLKMRGPSQFNSRLGRNMFLDITSDIFISCYNAGSPCLRPSQNSGDSLDSVAIQVVLQGRQLDTDLNKLMEHLFETRPYTVIDPASVPTSVYNKLAHHYGSHKSCWGWNNLRMMRFFVNKWIARAEAAAESALQDSPEAVDVLKQSKVFGMAASTAERMAADILATVPYCNSLPAASNAQLATARWLIWPLSAVATSTVTLLPARIYARDSLYALGRDTGTIQATEAGKMVDESNDHLEDWLHITLLS